MTTDTHDVRTQLRERCRAILKESAAPLGADTLAVKAKAARPSMVNEALRESSDFRQVAGPWEEKGWRWCLSTSMAAIDARRECVRRHSGAGTSGGEFHNTGRPAEPIQEGDGNGRGLTWESEQMKARKGEAAVAKVRELMSTGEGFTLDEIRKAVGITHVAAKGAVQLLKAEQAQRKVPQVVEGRTRIQTITTWVLPAVSA